MKFEIFPITTWYNLWQAKAYELNTRKHQICCLTKGLKLVNDCLSAYTLQYMLQFQRRKSFQHMGCQNIQRCTLFTIIFKWFSKLSREAILTRGGIFVINSIPRKNPNPRHLKSHPRATSDSDWPFRLFSVRIIFHSGTTTNVSTTFCQFIFYMFLWCYFRLAWL